MNENERVQQDYVQEIIDLLRSGEDIETLQEKLEEYHANDIASALPLLEEDERKLLYNTLEMSASVRLWSMPNTAIFI